MARRVRSPLLRLSYWISLTVSAALLFACVWILVPAPNRWLLPFGVGAPELSPALLAVASALLIVNGLYARLLGTARLGFVLAAVAAALCSWPLIQLPSVLRRFDDTIGSLTGSPSNGTAVSLWKTFRVPRETSSRVVRGIPFASPEGVVLTLDVYKPSHADRPAPIVVQIYGGAWQRGSPSDNEWFSRYFASKGYVVVTVDYRHAPGWKWPAQADDIRSAMEWIHAHAPDLEGDSARIIVIGRSAGAQLAMTTAFRTPSKSIRGIVSLYGPVDLTDGWRHPPDPDPIGVRSVLEAYLGGTPAQVGEKYRDASPISLTTRRLPPVLLIYGRRDHVVEARFGRQMEHALKAAGTPVALLEIPWSEHAFDALPNGLGGQIALFYMERFMAWAVR